MSLALHEATTARVPFARPFLTEEAQAAAARVLASGWLTTGPEVVEFEKDMAEWVGADHAIAVASCTAAIEIALRALRLPPGAAVLTSTMTFCGAVHAILHAGLRPVLVDVNPTTLMPDGETTAAAVRRHGKPEAMVVLHYAGHPAPVEELAAAAGLPLTRVVEDAAHALAAKVGDRNVGTISAATCFSFYATKNLPIGEGGMITTADPDLAAYARQSRLHGMSTDAWKRYLPGAKWRYQVEVEGLKANLTDAQAAIGRAQLKHLAHWQELREQLAAAFDARLRSCEWLVRPAWPEHGTHAWHLYVIRILASSGLERDAFMAQMGARGIDCSVHFTPVHELAYFRKVLGREAIEGLTVAEAVSREVVSLPFYPNLSEAEFERVCDEVAMLTPYAGARSLGGGGRS